MRVVLATAMTLALSAQAVASDCPLHEALYRQPGNDWILKFFPVPADGAANQISAFEIYSPGDPALVLEGAIHIPNGFGQPLGVVTMECEADTECEPFWEGTVYALIDGGIAEFPWDPDQPRDAMVPPEQVLLPQFASNVWYSLLRETAFAEAGVLDTFSYFRCSDEG
jgi:hypothetical protein